MGYDIPLQLQHKEKILFGLTFPQLGWATLFLMIILFIFSFPLSLTSKIILSLFPALLGILFIFFDFSKWFKHLISFFLTKTISSGSLAMKNLIGVQKIDDNTLYSDEEVAVLRITPMNFSIKNDEDKGFIVSSFQKFLNSLDYPVQLLITTKNLDINKYLDESERKSNNKSLFKDFKTFISNKISSQDIHNREFLLIIPNISDLDIQSKVCIQRLQSMGLMAQRLHNKQLILLLKDFFKTPKKKLGKTISELISPNKISDNIDYLEIDGYFHRVICASGYPRSVESGFLDKIISSNDDFDISIHIEPFSIESIMILLNKELEKQRADLYAEEKKHSINPSLEIKYQDTKKVLEHLQKGNEKLFNVSLYINCKAKTKTELDLLTKKVQSELNSLMIIPQVPLFQQKKAYQSILPTCKDHLKNKRNITTKALSAFFPFTSPFLNIERDGVMLGVNKNKIPYIKNLFGLSNANGVVLATSGSGKSYFTKLLISRHLMNNTKAIVIDPQGEYTGLVKHCNGEQITISKNSKTIINPLDLMGHDFIEKRLALMDLFKIMFGELSEIQKSILDRALNETYAKYGITVNSYKNKKCPILSDLYAELSRMEKKASQSELITYRALLNRLYMYTEGVFGFLNKPTSIDFDNNFVCFNIGDMPKQVKPTIMFLILDYVYMKMKSSKEKKLLVVDEAWSLLGHAEEASYLFEIVKTCRKYNMGLLLITQDVADLVNSKAGKAVLANSAYTFLLRQKPAIIDSVTKNFRLSNNEKEYLLTANKGKGILILDNEHQELEVIASPKEHQIITTNPNEKTIEKDTIDNRKEVKINLDLDKKLFYGRNLDLEEKNYLLNHGYEVGQFVPIGKPRQEECWIKTNKIESIDHTFLVHNIKEELEKKGYIVEVKITNDADILIKTKKGTTIALEVETGKGFKKHKKRIKQKFTQVNLNYKHNYLFLTNPKMRTHYKGITNSPTYVRSEFDKFLISLKKIQ